MTDKRQAIVIGAGYPGCSVAYHLAKAGVRTLLLDKGEIGGGASGGNFGCVQVQDASLGLSLSLTLRSFERVMRFGEELEADLGIEPIGSLIAAASEAEMEELETLWRGKKDAGLDIEMLGPRALQEREPHIAAGEFLGATYYRQGRLNPFRLLYAMVRQGRRRGLEVREHTPVRELLVEGKTVCGVVLVGGEVLRADWVVVCAGAWTPAICSGAGVGIPIEYVRAEGFVTEKIRPFLRNYYSSASFFTDAHDVSDVGVSLCMSQTAAGNILVGETSKPGRVQPDRASDRTSIEHVREIRTRILRVFPALENAGILRAWTSVSPYTRSMEPVLGAVGPPGLLVAAGFKSCAVMTAVAGEIITDLVTTGETFCDLSGFNRQVREA